MSLVVWINLVSIFLRMSLSQTLLGKKLSKEEFSLSQDEVGSG
jgi:hypothetical protein